MINVNMTKAKDIWRDKIREERADKLATLDVQFTRALESGADTTDIVTKKQALRDAPADERITNATTPEELKQVDPVGEINV